MIRDELRVGNKNVLFEKENVGTFCLGFDGRKDQRKTSGGTVLEEHYTIMKESGPQ